MTEACKEYTHLDGQLANIPLHMLLAHDDATPNGGEGTTPDFNPMSCHSEVLLHVPGMPKIAGEDKVGVLPSLVLWSLFIALSYKLVA